MGAVQERVEQFAQLGAFVLSPSDPRIVDQFGDFVFVASDRVRRIRTVQGRHLEAIGASDLLWLVAPDGYVGQSAAMEIGYAAARDIPVYSDEVPSDLTLRQWVEVVSGPHEAMRLVDASAGAAPACLLDDAHGAILLDPLVAIEASHDDLALAGHGLAAPRGEEDTVAAEAALRRVHARTALS